MVDHTERERGILSRADRDYLLGESDIEEKSQQERNARARIRQRVTDGLLDFALLNQHLSDRDRRMIADKLRDEYKGQYVLDRAADECLVPVLAFCYALSLNLETDFAIPVERAVKDVEMGFGALSVDDSERVRDIEITFAVERDLLPDLDDAERRFERGEPLTDSELGALVREGRLTETDLEQLQETE